MPSILYLLKTHTHSHAIVLAKHCLACPHRKYVGVGMSDDHCRCCSWHKLLQNTSTRIFQSSEVSTPDCPRHIQIGKTFQPQREFRKEYSSVCTSSRVNARCMRCNAMRLPSLANGESVSANAADGSFSNLGPIHIVHSRDGRLQRAKQQKAG